MGIVITREDIIAYAEVDYIINHMNEKYIKKVPEKLLDFFRKIKDPDYIVNINPRVPLQNQNLKTYTLELIALLHLRYWCEDEERKKMLYEKMLENQRKLDGQMKEKYKLENMFELNSTKVVNSSENSSLENKNIEYSAPKNITKYDVIAQNNSSITDYTGVEENKLKDYLSTGTKEIEKLEKQEKAILSKTNFLLTIINKIKSAIFKK